MNGLLAGTIGIAGLFLPGLAVAFACRMPMAALSAFPLSCLLLSVGISLAAFFNLPITMPIVAVFPTVAAIVSLLVCRIRQPPERVDCGLAVDPENRFSSRLAWFGLGLITLAVAMRTAVFPLAGFDTLFRWDLLARLLFSQHSLAFYPPREAADFFLYPYVDSIPPLTSGVYWWLYEMGGSPSPSLTAIAVTAQFICCCGLTWQAASLLSGQWQPPVSALLLAGSPLFIQGVAIGQETGWTAISVAGQAAAALAATRRPTLGVGIVAGLYAGIGCLARDYGPSLALCGLLCLAWTPQTRRLTPVFLLITTACGIAWYLRTWLLTGNPVYSNPTPLGLPANPVHAGILQQYAASLSPFRWPPATVSDVALAVASGAGAVALAGGLGITMIGLRGVPLFVTGVVIALLWAWSAAFTAGGAIYSLRVLAPLWVILGILSGAAIASVETWLDRLRWPGLLRVTPLVLWLGWGVAAAAAHPYAPVYVMAAWDTVRASPIDGYPAEAALVTALDKSSLPSCGILTDDAYLAAALIRFQSRFHPVMVWSPEVESLCDAGLSVAAGHRFLSDRNVRLVSIGQDSLNWAFLNRHQFYRNACRDWRPVFAAGSRKILRLPSQPVLD